ncbi:linoleate diol synthase [Staphylotrichum tortipilum]|uniref:Linoleate diol synthase n=1 Tax=Staphylotrichum tortipilum TaxID=2831512 RepID=A0AAN6MH75_9PEZI|nr:linoleate diol synthase [Staphylotrichum longicolle]
MAPEQNGEKTNGQVNGASHASPTTPIEIGERLAGKAKPKPAKPKQKPTKADKKGVANAFKQHGQVLQAVVKPLPNQGGAGTFYEKKRWGKLRDDVKTLRSSDWKTLKTMLVTKLKGETQSDDKTMIMERVIQLVSNLPSDSKLRVELTNTFLGELWYSLEHPPSLYVGEKYQYRQADGSYNNILFPQLGAAGTAYARSVNATVLRPGALPDPGLVYDSVMKRTEYKKHPNNVSSVLWYWASIIIHDLFWTDYRDMNKSKTSSYLDLSPLYGSNQEMQDTIRTFKGGKLKPDCFADKRLLGMPPGVGVLLIMFNRVHNYVADNLIAINEDGKFTPPSPALEGERAAAAWKKYDNDVFQTARLITSGLYINITLLDYVRNIVNLNRVDTTWTLDPRQNTGIDVGTHKGAERGTGNVVSAEFNLCYRWHSCISEKDDKWIEQFYHDLFGKPGSEVTVQDLVMGFAKYDGKIPEDPLQRPFAGFKRGPDGKISDDDLVECITSSVEDVAGSFGARNVPASMRAIEILGIIQGRKWNVAGLNEFRKHFGLKPYETFEDINSDPGVSESLRRLYDHPDFVELYPGLVAEEHKAPMVPGVGIAPTYTISRVVLSDAVCLVRGDRHYTVDYSPRNLTNWGYNDVQYDLNINHGCVFYKLFIRAFPHHFKHNSVYAHYPMVVPSETEKILKDLKRDHLFDFSRPARLPVDTEVKSSAAAQAVLSSPGKYSPSWHAALEALSDKGNTRLSEAPGARTEAETTDLASHVKAFYRKVTEELLSGQSYELGGHRMVDLVRDVANITPVHFAASLFDLPVKSKTNPKGIYTDHELYAVLSTIASAVFTSPDPVRKFPLLAAAKTVAAQLATAIERTVKSPKSKKNEPLSAYGVSLINRLHKTKATTHEITWGLVLAASAAIVPYQGKLLAEAVDFYLSPAGVSHLETIRSLATQTPSADNDALLLGYALEGIRLSGATTLHFRATAADSLVSDDGTVTAVQAGDGITVSSIPSPSESSVSPSRPAASHSAFAALPSSTVLPEGRAISEAALTEMFRAVFKRGNLRRAPGPQGELKKVVGVSGAGKTEFLREDWGVKGEWPVTMKVCWDI